MNDVELSDMKCSSSDSGAQYYPGLHGQGWSVALIFSND